MSIVPFYAAGLAQAVENSPSTRQESGTRAKVAQTGSDQKDTVVLQLRAEAHDHARGDTHMGAGSSHSPLGDAYQTTIGEAEMKERLHDLLQGLRNHEELLRNWVDEYGLKVGDTVLYKEEDATRTPAVVTAVHPHTSSYTVHCQYDHSHTEQAADNRSHYIETSADRLSLVGRD